MQIVVWLWLQQWVVLRPINILGLKLIADKMKNIRRQLISIIFCFTKRILSDHERIEISYFIFKKINVSIVIVHIQCFTLLNWYNLNANINQLKIIQITVTFYNTRIIYLYKMKMKKLSATISRLLSFSKFGKTKMWRRRLTLNQSINSKLMGLTDIIFLSVHFLSDITSLHNIFTERNCIN